MKCQWQPYDDGGKYERYVCAVCRLDVTLTGEDPAKLLAEMPECKGKAEASPPAFRARGRVRRYFSATAAWIKAGRPVRTTAEIKRIFDDICLPCEHYRETSGECGVCGCKVKRRGMAITNKISYATENCDLGKW